MVLAIVILGIFLVCLVACKKTADADGFDTSAWAKDLFKDLFDD